MVIINTITIIINSISLELAPSPPNYVILIILSLLSHFLVITYLAETPPWLSKV